MLCAITVSMYNEANVNSIKNYVISNKLALHAEVDSNAVNMIADEATFLYICDYISKTFGTEACGLHKTVICNKNVDKIRWAVDYIRNLCGGEHESIS